MTGSVPTPEDPHPFSQQVRAIAASYLAGAQTLEQAANQLANLWDEVSASLTPDSELGQTLLVLGFPGFVLFPLYSGHDKDHVPTDGAKITALIGKGYERYLAIERGRLTSA